MTRSVPIRRVLRYYHDHSVSKQKSISDFGSFVESSGILVVSLFFASLA